MRTPFSRTLLTLGLTFGFVLGSTAVQFTSAAADVTCKDGTTSPGGQGACSHHGGVAKVGAASAPVAAPASGGQDVGNGAPTTSMTCKDGTPSKGGRGACRGHGGIAKAGAAPAAVNAPPQAAGEPAGAMCKDGTHSAKSGQGACSHHGGIASAAGATAPVNEHAPSTTGAAAPSGGESSGGTHADPTGATAKCKDGTFSHSAHHSGSCSHHGGVAEWLDGSGK